MKMEKILLEMQIIILKWEMACHSFTCNECIDGILVCDEGWKLRMKHACLTKKLWQISENGKEKELSWVG